MTFKKYKSSQELQLFKCHAFLVFLCFVCVCVFIYSDKVVDSFLEESIQKSFRIITLSKSYTRSSKSIWFPKGKGTFALMLHMFVFTVHLWNLLG